VKQNMIYPFLWFWILVMVSGPANGGRKKAKTDTRHAGGGWEYRTMTGGM